jgi:hypothetical protein
MMARVYESKEEMLVTCATEGKSSSYENLGCELCYSELHLAEIYEPE